MAFEDDIKKLADGISNFRDRLQTEEATKQSLVLPFLQALGYNVFDPDEVEPEFDADFGETRGWKADYALKSDRVPVIIIECKQVSNNLSGVVPQLGRYFPHTKARIGVLTNGLVYKFFTDQNEINKMDESPFWEFNLQTLSDRDLEQLEKFLKGSDVADAVTAASRLKYIAGMKQTLSQQYHQQPDDAFAEWLARPLLPPRSRMTEDIKNMAQQALREFVTELVTGSLARGNQTPEPISEEEPSFLEFEETEGDVDEENNKVETTDDELRAYDVVKEIVGELVDASRVILRDNPSYCPVFLDNNRKPLVRFFFDRSPKQIGLFDGSRYSSGALIATIFNIDSISDLHNHADQIRETTRRYLES